MIRNFAFTFAFTFGIALLSMATISQTANAQAYRTSGCYCQPPVQVVRTCQAAQPIRYYQPVSSYYSPVAQSTAMVSGTVQTAAPQAVYSGIINTNNLQAQYPVEYSTPVSTETIFPAAPVDGITRMDVRLPVADGLIINPPSDVVQAGLDNPITTATTIEPVATSDAVIDASATPPAADAPTTATPLKVDSSTDAPTPASEKSILSK